MRRLLHTVEVLDLVERVERWRESSMDAKDRVVDDGREAEAVEDLDARLPYRRGAVPVNRREGGEGGEEGAAAAADTTPVWAANSQRMLEGHLINFGEVEVVSAFAANEEAEEKAEAEADGEEWPYSPEDLPPFAAPDAAWTTIDAKRADFGRIFLRWVAAMGSPAAAEADDESANVGCEATVIALDTALQIVGEFGPLLKGIEAEAKELFLRAQEVHIEGATGPPTMELPEGGAPAPAANYGDVDFDEFMTWVWMLLKEKYGFRKEGFDFPKLIEEWVNQCPQFGGAPAAPQQEPEPQPKSPGPKKGKK